MPIKRKSTALGLERRVRARREEEWEPEAALEESSDEESGDQASEGEEEDADDTGSDSDSEVASDEDDAPQADSLSSISFGALARAQESLPPSHRKSKSSTSTTTSQATASGPSNTSSSARKDSKAEKPDLKRSSKHAPQEISAKRQVTRRREIIPDTRRKSRDPRFDPLVGAVDESRVAKAYSFLDEYRESEMADLRARIKKTKDSGPGGEKERLKRELLSMESRKKARLKKEEAARVLDEHRRKEKELVAQGKKPFYLKESERKKKVLVERYAGMSKGQVDRAIERKRKKVASKEKKELAMLERRRH